MWRFHAERAENALRRRGAFLRALAREHGSDRFDHFAAELVYCELVGNAMSHARGPIDVEVRCAGRDAVLSVYDRGNGFEFHPTLPESPLDEHGRGLFLVAQFSRSVNVRSFPRHGTCVSAVLPLDPVPGFGGGPGL
jgi:anti-sigma regulatory factor (Ser/Thr protein kinase)